MNKFHITISPITMKRTQLQKNIKSINKGWIRVQTQFVKSPKRTPLGPKENFNENFYILSNILVRSMEHELKWHVFSKGQRKA